jgi:hypothetical protein
MMYLAHSTLIFLVAVMIIGYASSTSFPSTEYDYLFVEKWAQKALAWRI